MSQSLSAFPQGSRLCGWPKYLKIIVHSSSHYNCARKDLLHPAPQILVKPEYPGKAGSSFCYGVTQSPTWAELAPQWGSRCVQSSQPEPLGTGTDPRLSSAPLLQSQVISSPWAAPLMPTAKIEFSRQLSTNIFGELSKQRFTVNNMDKCFLQVQLDCSCLCMHH